MGFLIYNDRASPEIDPFLTSTLTSHRPRVAEVAPRVESAYCLEERYGLNGYEGQVLAAVELNTRGFSFHYRKHGPRAPLGDARPAADTLLAIRTITISARWHECSRIYNPLIHAACSIAGRFPTG